MGFWKKRFPEDEYENQQEHSDVEETVEQEEDYREPEFSQERNNVFGLNGKRVMEQSADMNMVIFRPTEYEQAQTIIDYLKLRKPIIVNLDEIEVSVAQRILDFITGAVYALAGDIKKAARNIFVVVPSNVEISNANDDADRSADFVDDDYANDEI